MEQRQRATAVDVMHRAATDGTLAGRGGVFETRGSSTDTCFAVRAMLARR